VSFKHYQRFAADYSDGLLESDIGFFSLVGDSEYLFVGLMHDGLFDPAAMQSGTCGPPIDMKIGLSRQEYD
jgi:hypothetical protein